MKIPNQARLCLFTILSLKLCLNLSSVLIYQLAYAFAQIYQGYFQHEYNYEFI